MPLQRLPSLSETAPQTWDALVPHAQPFVRHAFLSALEDSGSRQYQFGRFGDCVPHLPGRLAQGRRGGAQLVRRRVLHW